MKSSRESSAHCMSSNTSAVGFASDSLSKKSLHAANRSSRSKRGPSSRPSKCATRGSMKRRSSSSSTCSTSVASSLPTADPGSSSSAIRQRIRTRSASAQYVTPSPYERHRPRCQYVSCGSPSMYLKNSQASRLFPMPAIPVTETRCALPSSAQPWKRSLISRSSRSRPTKGASSPCDLSAPRAPETTRSARYSG